MNRKLKMMGLALVAAMALSAVVASAAQASFNSSVEHTILSGEQKEGTLNKFTATGGFAGVTCTTATFSGTATSEAAEAQSISPNYSNCEDSLGRNVDVDNNGLTYEFTTNGQVHVTGSIALTITNGSEEVKCTDTVSGPQTDESVTYNNLGGTSGVEVVSEVANAVNTTSGGLLNCGTSNGTHTNGTYEGEAVITGVDTEGNPAEISVTP